MEEGRDGWGMVGERGERRGLEKIFNYQLFEDQYCRNIVHCYSSLKAKGRLMWTEAEYFIR